MTGTHEVPLFEIRGGTCLPMCLPDSDLHAAFIFIVDLQHIVKNFIFAFTHTFIARKWHKVKKNCSTYIASFFNVYHFYRSQWKPEPLWQNVEIWQDTFYPCLQPFFSEKCCNFMEKSYKAANLLRVGVKQCISAASWSFK